MDSAMIAVIVMTVIAAAVLGSLIVHERKCQTKDEPEAGAKAPDTPEKMAATKSPRRDG